MNMAVCSNCCEQFFTGIIHNNLCFKCNELIDMHWTGARDKSGRVLKNPNGQVAEHPKRGTKNDNEKPDLSLIPKDALWEMAKAFTHGAGKYGRHNYREGIEISRLLAAAMRHITQYNEGENLDPETKCLHLGNAMAGLAMAIYMHYNKPEMDNRYKVLDKSSK